MRLVQWYLAAIVITCVVARPCGVYAQQTASAKENGPLSIAISSAGGRLVAGSPIVVTITLRNNGSQDAFWDSERPDPAYRNFRFSLTLDGEKVQSTAYHRKITGQQLPTDPSEIASGSSAIATLSAGQSAQFKIDVSRLYEIAKPGSYILIVERLPDQFTKIRLRSNALNLEVAP